MKPITLTQIPERTVVASGLHVQISGQYVKSDVHISISGIDVTATVTVNISGEPVKISGENVWISGQHVFIGSGIYVTTQPEIAISGTVSVQSGLHVVVGSGLGVIGDFTTEVASGLHVVGDFSTTVDSGLHVWISGQHVYQESGTYGTTEAACVRYLRVGIDIPVVAQSGGVSICTAISGYWCSGQIDKIQLKNFSGNDTVRIGFSGCRPWSGGYGFPLEAGDEKEIPICNACLVYLVGYSGQEIGWMGTQY